MTHHKSFAACCLGICLILVAWELAVWGSDHIEHFKHHIIQSVSVSAFGTILVLCAAAIFLVAVILIALAIAARRSEIRRARYCRDSTDPGGNVRVITR